MTLPPLPRPLRLPTYGYQTVAGYTADQMDDYAAQCVQAERERCLDICQQHFSIEYVAQDIWKAIRAQGAK